MGPHFSQHLMFEKELNDPPPSVEGAVATFKLACHVLFMHVVCNLSGFSLWLCVVMSCSI